MKKRLKILFVFFYIFVFVLNLFARTFPLEEAIELAKQKDPDLKILIFELEQLSNNILQNKVEILPKINFVAESTNESTFESNLVYKNSKLVSELVPVDKYSYDVHLVGEQKIIDLAYMSKIGALKKKYDAEYSGYLQKKQDISFNVIAAYYSLIKSEQTKKIIEQDINILEDYLQDMHNKFELNFETRQALLNTEISLNSKKQELYKNDQIYYADRTEFAGLLEFPLSLNFEVLNFEELYKIELLDIQKDSVRNILQKAMAKRFDVEKLLITNESLVKEKRSIKKGFLPTFSLQGAYGYLNEEQFSNVDKDNYWSLSVVGKFNIFNGMYDYLKIKEVDTKLSKNYQEIQNFSKKLEIEIDEIMFYLEIQTKMYEDSKSNIEICKQNLTINQNMFFQKQITKDELVNAQLKYNSAKLSYIESKVDLLLSQKKYEYIVGDLKS